MGFFSRLRAFLSNETAEVRDKLDATLTRKEQELTATPNERLEMTLDDIDAEGDPLDRVADKIGDKAAAADAQAQVRDVVEGTEADEDDGPTIDEKIEAADAKAAERVSRREATEERAEEILDELRSELDPD